MCRDIAVGETLWGVATWEDIDPRIVRFSVYVFGLTNAYRGKTSRASTSRAIRLSKVASCTARPSN